MILVLVALACVSSGCRKQEARERQDLDFTVCAETELPDDLRQIIEDKKLHAFQMSYTTKDHLYIVVGYGEHDRTNLCVVVEELLPEMPAGEHSNIGTIFFAVGFTLMLILDVALG